MAVTATLIGPDRFLVTELAVGIARRLEGILDPEGGAHIGPGYVHHIYMSHFEDGCSVLWRLGVAIAAWPGEPSWKGLSAQAEWPNRIFPPFFKLLAPSEIRETLTAGLPPSSPSLHEVLCAYLALVCDYIEPQLSSRREPFVAAEECAREIEALQESGYLERCGAAVRWTDRVAAGMQENYLWQADGRSMAEIVEAGHAAQLAAAMAEMPEPVRRVLSQEAMHRSELEFLTFAKQQHPTLSWVRNPYGEPPYAGPLGLAKAVYLSLRTQED